MKRCDLTKGLVFFLTIIITLCCGLIPSSWALDDVKKVNCGKIFKGQYAYSQAGLFQVAPGVSLNMGAVGSFFVDGKGYITRGTETLVMGENTIIATFDGTYVFDEHCMGTADIEVNVVSGISPSPLYLKMALTLTEDGKKVYLLTTEINDINGEPLMQPHAVVGSGTKGNE